MKEAPFPFRFIEVRGAKYLRLEDVTAFLRELGGGEETDVRNRLNEAARQVALGQPIARKRNRSKKPECL